MVTITFYHGFFEDCDAIGTWAEYGSPTLTATSMAVYYGDYFRITGTASAAAKFTWFAKGAGLISTTTFPYLLIRYRTQEAAGSGLGAAVVLDYTVGHNWVIGDGSDVNTPTDGEFSQTWTTVQTELDAGKTINNIALAAVSDAACTAKWVEYDCLLCSQRFTFPNNIDGPHIHFPVRLGVLPIPGKITDSIQPLGNQSATVTINGDLDQGDWKHWLQDADVFYDISHNVSGEPWQWLDTGAEQFKVTLEDAALRRSVVGGKAERRLELTFKEYSQADKSNEYYYERFGLDQ